MGGTHIDVTDEQFKKIMNNKDQKLLLINGRMMNPSSISSSMPIADAKKLEADKLKLKGMWRCAAGNIHKAGNFNDPHAWQCNCKKPLPKQKQISGPTYSEKLLKQIPPSPNHNA